LLVGGWMLMVACVSASLCQCVYVCGGGGGRMEISGGSAALAGRCVLAEEQGSPRWLCSRR
jgi:hypothetical protein